MITDEQAKAVQETAKAAVKTVETLEKVGGFIGKVIGAPLEQASGILGDHLKYVRWERQLRLVKKAEEDLVRLGVSDKTRPVPLKIAVPLLQAATIEEDNNLQDMWARLLVNAMDPDSRVDVERSFVSIVQDFGPMEAMLLEKIHDAPVESLGSGYVRVSKLLRDCGYIGPDTEVPPDEFMVALWNLVRLGCVTPEMLLAGLSVINVSLTTLGRKIVAACRAREE